METKITEDVYKTALARIEELLPLVTDDTSTEDRRACYGALHLHFIIQISIYKYLGALHLIP